MASLRDVFDHAGKRVIVERHDGTRVEGLGLLREGVALVESKLEPKKGETLTFVEGGKRFRIEESQPETRLGRVDHFQLRVSRL